MQAAIEVSDLSKRYILAHREKDSARYETLRDKLSPRGLLQWISGNPGSSEPEEFWALRDVGFQVPAGQVVGIIGRNGAGKSTLLKVLSRITEPTTGRVALRGRVASLLEVGTGFHPELTGRENIFLNGAILGMYRSEIRRKFDEIVAFAEVERFLDTPVKRYSSGMYVRLAFAVAAHLEPEILIVDEVLAVGDAAFQKKCLGKLQSVARNDARTVFFVSHNMIAVNSLCDRCLMMEGGRLKMDGAPADVTTAYLTAGEKHEFEHEWEAPKDPASRKAWLRKVSVQPASNGTGSTTSGTLFLDDPLNLAIDYDVATTLTLNLSVSICASDGTCIFVTTSSPSRHTPGRTRAICRIPPRFLNDESYHLRILLVQDSGTVVQQVDDALVFHVLERERQTDWHGKWPGLLRPQLEWSVNPAPVPT